MKKISFAAGAPEFDLLYQATLFANKDKISAEEHTTIAVIRKALKKIGEPIEASWDKASDPRRRLVLYNSPNGGDVLLESAEHILLLALFDATEWKSFMSEDASAARKLLASAPDVPVSEVGASA